MSLCAEDIFIPPQTSPGIFGSLYSSGSVWTSNLNVYDRRKLLKKSFFLLSIDMFAYSNSSKIIFLIPIHLQPAMRIILQSPGQIKI
ncbi:uncharacterized protein MONOS_17588 [Monocercomonoides exilis]|uniref:uncharacterized protein n=1 Tax=Monocercomonoides exilis TaxID=2049356 RepID=UPI003559EE03|nr:hypothetical protein MONOS_17588 [Monocercomonoides exilis]